MGARCIVVLEWNMEGGTRMEQIPVRCGLLQVRFQQETDSEMEMCFVLYEEGSIRISSGVE